MVDEESHGAGPSGGGQGLAGVGARMKQAQVALAAKALPPECRETVMHGLVTALDELRGLIEAVSATDMRLNPAGVATVAAGEPQIRALREQTHMLDAGPDALSHQTMEDRTYHAWEGAAASLLRTVGNRDDMVAAAVEADLAAEGVPRPEQPVPLAHEPPMAKPEIDAYRYREAPLLLTGLTAISMVWLLVEVVIGVFGVEGLLNSWAVLGITVTLAWLGRVLATERIRPQYRVRHVGVRGISRKVPQGRRRQSRRSGRLPGRARGLGPKGAATGRHNARRTQLRLDQGLSAARSSTFVRQTARSRTGRLFPARRRSRSSPCRMPWRQPEPTPTRS